MAEREVTEMEAALALVRAVARKEVLMNGSLVTTFMGYTPAQIIAMRRALEEITVACEDDCGVPEPHDGDDEPVAATKAEHGPITGRKLTFGILRRARAALIREY